VRGVHFFADPMNGAIQGVGAHLWFAARALIDHVAPDGQGAVAQGARVCELGAGCGGVGLALHALSKCDVTLTDLPHVLPLLRFNAAHVACAVPEREPAHVAALRWGDAHDLVALRHQRFDVVLGESIAYTPGWSDAIHPIPSHHPTPVLYPPIPKPCNTIPYRFHRTGADIAYEPDAHEALLTTLEALSDGPHTRVLLALADRDDGTLKSFLHLAIGRGWRFMPVVIAHRGDEDYAATTNPVVVLEGRSPPPAAVVEEAVHNEVLPAAQGPAAEEPLAAHAGNMVAREPGCGGR
jgi:hypothetical protein